MSEIQTFTLSLITGGSASAIVVWLARNWISERIKNSIKHEYDAKLETHKAQLQIAATERSVRYSKIFEEIAVTVAETYKLLLAVHDSVASYTSIVEFAGDPSKADRRKIVGEKMTQFHTYYRPRKLFLPRITIQRIDEFLKQLHKISMEFMLGVEQDGDTRRRRTNPDLDVDTWMKAHEFMNKEVPPILGLLEDDLRKILGTTDAERKTQS